MAWYRKIRLLSSQLDGLSPIPQSHHLTYSINQVIKAHLLRYPQMQIADMYKLLHQAALGSEHAVRDEQAVRDWLERELSEMEAGPNDPLFDPISPDGKILRIHLRPYVRAGKNPEPLLRAFIQTANEWHGSPETLKEYGTAAANWAMPWFAKPWRGRRMCCCWPAARRRFAAMNEPRWLGQGQSCPKRCWGWAMCCPGLSASRGRWPANWPPRRPDWRCATCSKHGAWRFSPARKCVA